MSHSFFITSQSDPIKGRDQRSRSFKDQICDDMIKLWDIFTNLTLQTEIWSNCYYYSTINSYYSWYGFSMVYGILLSDRHFDATPNISYYLFIQAQTLEIYLAMRPFNFNIVKIEKISFSNIFMKNLFNWPLKSIPLWNNFAYFDDFSLSKSFEFS